MSVIRTRYISVAVAGKVSAGTVQLRPSALVSVWTVPLLPSFHWISAEAGCSSQLSGISTGTPSAMAV